MKCSLTLLLVILEFLYLDHLLWSWQTKGICNVLETCLT